MADPAIPSSVMRARFLRLFSGAINDVLRFEHKHFRSAFPSDYRPLRSGMKLCGRAFTVKGGPDLTTDGEFEARARMLEAIHEDAVTVWDCTGDVDTAQWGEVMTMAVVKQGCRGAVVNGVRDVDAILRQDFPVFHKYTTPTGMLGRFRIHHYQQPVLIGDVVVHPGDWIFADTDGVLAIPATIAEAVLVSAEQVLAREKTIKDMVQSGLSPSEIVARGGYF